MARRPRTRTVTIASFMAALALLAALGAVAEARAARHDAERWPAPGRRVDIGGRRLHIRCDGDGGPVVVLDAGLGQSSLDWSLVQPALAARGRVCSYDRAGMGWSDPGPAPGSAEQTVADLRTLLAAAGEPPPYVLVGHSAGVNTVRLFAARFPDAVHGLVLVEPPLIAAVPPAAVAGLVAVRRGVDGLRRVGALRWLGPLGLLRLLYGGASPPPAVAARAPFLYRPAAIRATRDEIRALPETIRQVRAAAAPGAWRDWPVVVVAAAGPEPSPRLAAGLAALAALSSRGRVVYADSSHFVLYDRPAVVIEAVRAVVEADR